MEKNIQGNAKERALDTLISRLTDRINSKFAVSVNKPFSQMTIEEIKMRIDYSAATDKKSVFKKKGRTLLPYIQDIRASHYDKIENLNKIMDILVQRNKIVHKLLQDDFERQMHDLQKIITSGFGNEIAKSDLKKMEGILAEKKEHEAIDEKYNAITDYIKQKIQG